MHSFFPNCLTHILVYMGGMGWHATYRYTPYSTPPHFLVLIPRSPLAGRRFHTRRCYWGHAYSREVVSWPSGLLSQFPQHYACAGRGGSVLHAQGAICLLKYIPDYIYSCSFYVYSCSFLLRPPSRTLNGCPRRLATLWPMPRSSR